MHSDTFSNNGYREGKQKLCKSVFISNFDDQAERSMVLYTFKVQKHARQHLFSLEHTYFHNNEENIVCTIAFL